jgi:hypothetical protein
LKDIKDPKACWDKLHLIYGSEGLLHDQDILDNFHFCKYEGEAIDEYGCKYQAAIDESLAADMLVGQEKVFVLRFLTSLDSYFEHWVSSKRNEMHQLGKNAPVPSLSRLINEVCDESRCKERSTLQVTAVSAPAVKQQQQLKRSHSNNAEVCATCRLPGHPATRCFYAHPELSPPGWAPNASIQSRIQSNPTNLAFTVPSPAPSASAPAISGQFWVQLCHGVNHVQEFSPSSS